MPKHPRKRKAVQSGPKKGRLPKQLQDQDPNSVYDISEDEQAKKSDLLMEALKVDRALDDPFHDELRLLGLQDGGFLESGSIRRECWLRLLQLDNQNASSTTRIESPISPDLVRQFELDVARSYGNLNQGAAAKRIHLRNQLRRFFARNPTLHYYQGFHDVLMVIIDVFENAQEQLQVAEQLSHNFLFKDAHGPDFRNVEALLRVSQELLQIVDHQCAAMLQHFPGWGLSMLLTCFAHDVPCKPARLRLFDAMVASQPHFLLYLVAALPLMPDVRVAVLAADDPAIAHDAVRKSACNIKSVREADHLVRQARALAEKVPPTQKLIGIARICALPGSSVMMKKFELDPRWSPLPEPRLPISKVGINWKWFVAANDSRRYWFVAVAVVILAATLGAHLSTRH